LHGKRQHDDRNWSDLDRMVLEAVSKDYVPLESIIRSLSAVAAATSDTIRNCLLTLIACQQIRAYLLHAEPPFYTVVTATEDTLDRYWFFITEEGERILRIMTGKEAVSSQLPPKEVN